MIWHELKACGSATLMAPCASMWIGAAGDMNVGVIFAPNAARPFYAWAFYLDVLSGHCHAKGAVAGLDAAKHEIEARFDEFLGRAQLTRCAA